MLKFVRNIEEYIYTKMLGVRILVDSIKGYLTDEVQTCGAEKIILFMVGVITGFLAANLVRF